MQRRDLIMIKPLFSGVCTALVTPFANGTVNYSMLEALLQRQLSSGISAVVLCGTTGESSTLSDEEKIIMTKKAKEYSGNRMRIIAGTGSNDTYHASSLSVDAQEAGADAVLVVTPYYNKANPEGLYTHFRTVATAVEIPVILYNVPSRTGVDLPVEVCRALSQIPNIVGIKEASADISKILRLTAACPEEFTVWTGNDNMVLAAAALGSQGVISVASNIVPKTMSAMTDAALSGRRNEALALQRKLLPLMEALFSDINPMPAKECLRLLGYDCGSCRLPLTQVTPEVSAKLRTALTLLSNS